MAPATPSVPVRVVAGFGVLIVAAFATAWLVVEQDRSTKWVEHTLMVQEDIDHLFGSLRDAEIAQRSFLLTSDRFYLDNFNEDLASIDPQLNRLSAYASDNPGQVAAVEKLRPVLNERRKILRETVALAQNGDSAAALAKFRADREAARLVDIRAVFNKMLDEENALLRERRSTALRQTYWASAGLVLSGAIILILAAVTILEQRRRLVEIGDARDKLAATVTLLQKEAKVRESAEAQVRQLQKMEAVGQLTGGIAHDFNNMLAVIIGALELARRRIDSDKSRALVYIDSAVEAAKRAAQLTARLLAFSRQQALEPRVLDVNKLVGGMSELLRRALGEDIRFETVLAGGLWTTNIDPGQLENAVLNLCINARDAMPNGGRLTIETANTSLDDAYALAHKEVAAGQYVCIAVTDTGTGMPPEVVERAFDPFYTTKGVGRGTGLGLSQVYGFVKQSIGHVKIYSEPGHGTTVKLYFPRYFGSSPAVILQAEIDETPRAKDDEIILVVEDDETVRNMSVDALRDLGYTVVQASSAEDALNMLTLQPRIDLMFTDIVMPGMNGRQLAEIASSRFPKLKIIYTTGYTRNAIIHNGVLDHGLAFLQKPFTLPQLAEKVRQALDR